jgi:hypothetical protein
MSSISWFFANASEPRPPGARDVATAWRARAALDREELAQRKRVQQAEQRADANPPDVRIRAWEKLHGVCMPVDSRHPVLDVIAVETRLTLDQVLAEQRIRQAARKPATRQSPKQN